MIEEVFTYRVVGPKGDTIYEHPNLKSIVLEICGRLDNPSERLCVGFDGPGVSLREVNVAFGDVDEAGVVYRTAAVPICHVCADGFSTYWIVREMG